MDVKRADTYEEIKPLAELCKAGKLFDVQKWIGDGKPVNIPVHTKGKARKRSPLEIAIETGFHSLVEVLLDGGASVEDSRYSPLVHVLWKRRLDLIDLLVIHGADIHSVSVCEAFDTWRKDIIEYFIEKGADLETDNPLAYALCDRIRPALGIFMSYKDRYPSFQEQLNIALRHHCKEGNVKWVALLLWAGGDPLAKGPFSPHYPPDPEEDDSALELAAFFGHFNIFKLKSIRLDPNHESYPNLLRGACRNETSDLLKMLLDKGFDPAVMEDKGSSLIQVLLYKLSCGYYPFIYSREEKNIDDSHSREKMKMIHMLARRGAKWEPTDRWEFNDARRSLLKMRSDYVMEFIWIMSEYKACSRSAIEELMRTTSIRSLVSGNLNRYRELLDALNP